jgi:hypothetical protein
VLAFLTLSLLYPAGSVFIGLILLDQLILRMKIGFGIDFPIDLIYVGSVILAFYYGFFYALLFLIYGFIIRILFGKYRDSHLIKQPIMVAIVYFISKFKLDLVLFGTLFYIIRYLITQGIDFFAFRKIDISMIAFRLLCVLTTFLILSIVQYFAGIF